MWGDLTLREFISMLNEHNDFIQCFRSTIVNIKFIDWVNHATLKMINGDELKIGRVYKENNISKFRD